MFVSKCIAYHFSLSSSLSLNLTIYMHKYITYVVI